MLDVRVNWRCNNEIWWCALADPGTERDLYLKLHYSVEQADQMIKQVAEAHAAGMDEPVPALGGEGESSVQGQKPPLTVSNVTSLPSDAMKRKLFRTKFCHAFWGRMECGLVLSSVSPWEVIPKMHGETRGGYVCRYCQGFWKQKTGSTRLVQLTGRRRNERVSVHLILDEPPQQAYNNWIRDRMEYYKRIEPSAPLRDEALDLDPNVLERLRFSVRNDLGEVSNLLWTVLLSNPERDGLAKIHEAAARRVLPNLPK